MKKITIIVLFTVIAQGIFAQAQKRDTVVLSVYNNNQRFMLYPMPFGKDRPDVDFTAPMVVALDTTHVLKADSKKDSTGKYPMRLTVERRCGKIPKDSLKGKVALLYMASGCDVSTQVYNAQQAGAIVVIVIHTTNNRDSVELPKQGQNQVRYTDASKVRIPCFTVRKGIGERLTQMLPSLVGIQRPRTDVNNPTSSVIAINTDLLNAEQTHKDSIAQAEQVLSKSLPLGDLRSKGWQLSPNPASDEVVIHYNFERMATINIEIFNEIGQIITTYELPDTQTGRLFIDTQSWHNGTYNVSIRSGSLKEVKRFVVAH